VIYLLIRQFDTFLFVFIRAVAILALVPFFGSRSLPLMVKIGTALVLALILTPILSNDAHLPPDLIGLSIGLMRELLLGLAIGLITRLVFSAIEIAGQVTGIQMGYAVATIIDPQSNSQLSIFAQFYNLIAILIFFSLNMHLMFIVAIKESFQTIPPYAFKITGTLLEGIVTLTGQMFITAIRLGAPIMIGILSANIAMGILARTVPQLNVFIIGFPITILLGLLLLLFSMPAMFSLLNQLYIQLSHNIVDLLRIGS